VNASLAGGSFCIWRAGETRSEMKEIMAGLQEARAQLDAVRSAMADPLKRWSTEPQRREVVPEVVAALSELISKEAAYQNYLEQVVMELAERIDRRSPESEPGTREGES
jgi:hypothetical protein